MKGKIALRLNTLEQSISGIKLLQSALRAGIQEGGRGARGIAAMTAMSQVAARQRQ
jgi:hypothetical protein